jgi:23S rRNA (uracil1939-C5)-methyltransferase
MTDNETFNVTITKLVHGGQGLGTLPDGRKVFVWNALPGEEVQVVLRRHKKSWAEGTALSVLKPSADRIEPKDPHFLATSPWQIMKLEAENACKADIIREVFAGENVELPDFTVYSDGNGWGYRNKMEYSFFGDDKGLHAALHNRGTHQKVIVEQNAIAMPAVEAAVKDLVAVMNADGCRAGDYKSVVIRADSESVAAALYSKLQKPYAFPIPASLKGLRTYFSDPKSPASVPTRLLGTLGSVELHDTLLDKQFTYDVDSFFQVNVPVFEAALKDIIAYAGGGEIVDMYSGVGSIGLSLKSGGLTLVEVDKKSAAMAKINAAALNPQATVVETSTELALDHIKPGSTVIFDPPRAGLHKKVIQQLLEVKPPKIIYLSCNPATQARDLSLLRDIYKLKDFKAYNFFPHTPHIETLACLEV